MTLPEEKVANIITSGDPEKPTIGDCYDGDTGEFLGNMTDGEGEPFITAPVSIEIFVSGFWYVYKLDTRTEHTIIGATDAGTKEG